MTSTTYLELMKMNAVKCVAQFKLQTVGNDIFLLVTLTIYGDVTQAD
jgi:hypothetical protein